LLDIMNASINGTMGSLTVNISSRSALTVVLAAPGYPESPQTGGPITGSLQYPGPDAMIFHAGTENKNGQVLSSGGRVLAVTGTGSDLATASKKAYAAINLIRFEGMHYRKDIGKKAFDLQAI